MDKGHPACQLYDPSSTQDPNTALLNGVLSHNWCSVHQCSSMTTCQCSDVHCSQAGSCERNRPRATGSVTKDSLQQVNPGRSCYCLQKTRNYSLSGKPHNKNREFLGPNGVWFFFRKYIGTSKAGKQCVMCAKQCK